MLSFIKEEHQKQGKNKRLSGEVLQFMLDLLYKGLVVHYQSTGMYDMYYQWYKQKVGSCTYSFKFIET